MKTISTQLLEQEVNFEDFENFEDFDINNLIDENHSVGVVLKAWIEEDGEKYVDPYFPYILDYNNDGKDLKISNVICNNTKMNTFAHITNVQVEDIEKCTLLAIELSNRYGYIEGDYQSLTEDLIRISFDFFKFEFVHILSGTDIQEVRKYMEKIDVSDVITIDDNFNIHIVDADEIANEIVELFTDSNLSLEDRLYLKIPQDKFMWTRNLLTHLHRIDRLNAAYSTVNFNGLIGFSSEQNFKEALSKTILKDRNVYLSASDGQLIISKNPVDFFA